MISAISMLGNVEAPAKAVPAQEIKPQEVKPEVKETKDTFTPMASKVEEAPKADPNDKLVQLKSLEALEEVAKGDANKVFIPFEATGALAGLGAVKEILVDNKKSKKE